MLDISEEDSLSCPKLGYVSDKAIDDEHGRMSLLPQNNESITNNHDDGKSSRGQGGFSITMDNGHVIKPDILEARLLQQVCFVSDFHPGCVGCNEEFARKTCCCKSILLSTLGK
jgi:hypothetical protein